MWAALLDSLSPLKRGVRRLKVGKCLIKGDIHEHVLPTSRRMITLVPFLSWRIINKDTCDRTRIQLSTGRRMIVNKTYTTKYFRRNGKNGGWFSKKINRRFLTKDTSRKTVDKVGGSENGFAPVRLGKMH